LVLPFCPQTGNDMTGEHIKNYDSNDSRIKSDNADAKVTQQHQTGQ
jgi:hypothetical protein